ncbi:MAG: transposase [Nocardioides sp.]|jgi:hypothetical protein
MDNYAAHKHKNIRDWLDANPRFKVHFTPTHASWMNLVEVWFGLVERQAVRRGVFKSVKDLNGKLRAYIEGWNKRAPVQQLQIRATSRGRTVGVRGVTAHT